MDSEQEKGIKRAHHEDALAGEGEKKARQDIGVEGDQQKAVVEKTAQTPEEHSVKTGSDSTIALSSSTSSEGTQTKLTTIIKSPEMDIKEEKGIKRAQQEDALPEEPCQEIGIEDDHRKDAVIEKTAEKPEEHSVKTKSESAIARISSTSSEGTHSEQEKGIKRAHQEEPRQDIGIEQDHREDAVVEKTDETPLKRQKTWDEARAEEDEAVKRFLLAKEAMMAAELDMKSSKCARLEIEVNMENDKKSKLTEQNEILEKLDMNIATARELKAKYEWSMKKDEDELETLQSQYNQLKEIQKKILENITDIYHKGDLAKRVKAPVNTTTDSSPVPDSVELLNEIQLEPQTGQKEDQTMDIFSINEIKIAEKQKELKNLEEEGCIRTNKVVDNAVMRMKRIRQIDEMKKMMQEHTSFAKKLTDPLSDWKK